MKNIARFMILCVIVNFAACATEYQTRGAATGGAIGGITGALLGGRNPWRGGVIGAALGAIAGATIADISVRGAQESVRAGRPVEYYTEDRRGRYYAEPEGYDPRTKCRKVREKVWENGHLVKDSVREVCEGERLERRY